MAGSQMRKVLRLGIFQGERCIEERLLRRRDPVTIGQTLSNTFVIPASSMPKSYSLFDLDDKGRYVLRVSDRMGGRLSLGDNDVVDLTRLRHVSQAKRTPDGYELSLDDNARGKVTIGETRILFQFVTPPTTSVGVLPAAMGGGAVAGFSTFLSVPIMVALLLSGIFQLGPLFYVMLQDWPEPEDFNEIPDWNRDAEVELFEEEEEEEEEEDDTEEDPLDGLEPIEMIEDEPSMVEDSTSESEDEDLGDYEQTDEPKTTEKVFEDKARGKELAAQLFAVEGGESIGQNIAAGIAGDSMANIGLENLDAEQFGTGSGGEDGVGLGLGTSGSATGEPGVKELGGSGSGGPVGGGPRTDDAPKEREKISFKIKEDTKLPSTVAKADKGSMEKVFRKKKGQIEKCYRRVVQRYGKKPGKLVVKLTISPEGKVEKVEVTADEVENGLGKCVKAKIKRWKFPATGKIIPGVYKRWVFS